MNGTSNLSLSPLSGGSLYCGISGGRGSEGGSGVEWSGMECYLRLLCENLKGALRAQWYGEFCRWLAVSYKAVQKHRSAVLTGSK